MATPQAALSDTLPDSRRRRPRRRIPLFSTFAACIVYFYLILPSLTVIPISFSENYSFSNLSFALYRRILESSTWMSSIGHSALVATIASSIAVLAGIPAAYAFSRGRFRGKAVAQMVVMCPLFVPVIVIALGIYFLGARSGTLGTLAILVLSHSMYAMPFVVVMVLSGLRQINPSLEQAAYVMGASSLRVFLQVVLPQIRISVLASWLFGFLVSFDEVVIAWFISGPATQTLPVRMYSNIMWDNTPEIAAVSTLLTLFSFVLCMAMIKVGGVNSAHVPTTRN